MENGFEYLGEVKNYQTGQRKENGNRFEYFGFNGHCSVQILCITANNDDRHSMSESDHGEQAFRSNAQPYFR